MGAWFEAEIKKTSFDENGDVRYHVIFDGYDVVLTLLWVDFFS